MCVCAQAGERTTKTVLLLFFRQIPEKEEQLKDYKKVRILLEYFIKVVFFTRTFASFFTVLETGTNRMQGSHMETQLFAGLIEVSVWGVWQN